MKRSPVRTMWLAIFLALFPVTASAQQAMIVTGHVTHRRAPLGGVRVRIEQFRTERVTDTEGRYSFLIPSSSVRGQTVTLTATLRDRHIPYLAQSVDIVLAGGALVQDFDLTIAEDVTAPATALGGSALAQFGDSLDLSALGAETSVAEALAAQVPGLDVRAAAEPGGAVALEHRGPRSLAGASQPLFVVDGIPVDNTVYSSSAERNGLGGFDYGTALQDLRLANVESIRWIRSADAVARFGGRAANGVVLVETRTGTGLLGLTISATQHIATATPLTLPNFQNQYGQGLNGQFEFFDGRGGGIYDNVDESWGPPLDGRALQQASLTEANRPEVLLWRPRPDNVRDYFRTGRSVMTSAALQHGGALGSFRIFFDDRDVRGLTPAQLFAQRDGGASVLLRPSSAIAITAHGTFARSRNENAPGTGFNAGNPVAEFTRMGRQVDIAALASHLRDSTGRQVSWNYTGHNNPFFTARENSNRSLRQHGLGAASLTYTPERWLAATVQGGIDDVRDARRFTIASGWMGGFPSVDGAGNFSRGGTQRDDIAARRKRAAFSLDATRGIAESARWTTGAGVDYEHLRQAIASVGTDSGTVLPDASTSSAWEGQSTRTGVFGRTGITFGDAGAISASLRRESVSLDSMPSIGSLFPAVSASYDMGRAVAAFRDARVFNGVAFHTAWWRSAGELSPYELQGSRLGTGGVTAGRIAPLRLVSQDVTLRPEATTTAEGGLAFAFARRHLSIGATFYAQQTEDVILPVSADAAGGYVNLNQGRISNHGVETELSIRAGDERGRSEWRLTITAAHNENRVDGLGDSLQTLTLVASPMGGLVQARVGAPLGVLVGSRYLRDAASGALLLRGGLPLADPGDPQQLGVSQPTWVLGLRNTIRRGWLTLSFVADGHIGGSLFSATRRSGSQAGTLAETAYRPDSGLLVSGLDEVTGQQNTQHVSTQDYFHALAQIEEPWVYSATYAKLREARLGLTLPTTLWSLPFESATLSLVGRNLLTWSRAGDIDPESTVRAARLGSLDLGQLPFARSIGLQLSLTP